MNTLKKFITVLGNDNCPNCDTVFNRFRKAGYDVVKADFQKWLEGDSLSVGLRGEAYITYADQNHFPVVEVRVVLNIDDAEKLLEECDT